MPDAHEQDLSFHTTALCTRKMQDITHLHISLRCPPDLTWCCLLQVPGEVSEAAALTEGIRPEALDEKQIEDLIAEHLQQHLEILPEQDLANALHDFVDKVGCAHCLHWTAPALMCACFFSGNACQ